MGYVVSKTCVRRAREREELSERLKQEFKDSHLRNQELIIDQNKIIIELLSNSYSVPETINKLIKSQKPLGDEFSKVLYDNLWNLYIED